MANTANIHILRSYANTSPTHLLDGQLAYSFVSNTLFIGSNTGVNIVADPSVRILAQAGYNQANAGTALAQAAYNLANTESSQVFTQAAYNTANSAQANTVVTQGVDVTQNTNISLLQGAMASANANILSLFSTNVNQNTSIGIIQGVDTTQNTSIQASFNVANSAASNTIVTQGVDVTQNTNISLLQGAMASANANIVSLFAIDITQNTSITTIQGVDLAQNANITLLQTGLNTANANTVYTQGVDVTQNTNITSVTNNLASNVSYFQGIENTQNTWISSNSVYSQAAFAQANLTAGGLVTANANTVFLTGALATANANTIVTQGVDVTQNTNIAILQAVNATQNSNIASVIANTIYTQGVDVTQNTSIQGAYNTANTGYTFVTSGGTVTGNTTINGNLNVVGNISFVGNVINTTISGNTGQFFGNTLTGFGALYAGVPTGYTIEPQTAFQVSTNYNGYAQVNHQNINSGNNASGDFVVTSDNGSTNDTFIDMGINSSHYNQPNGFALTGPNDGYLYVYGNTSTGGGQLILATMTQNDIVLATNGQNSPNEVMRVGANGVVAIKSTNTSISTSSGALVVSGGVGISGNVFTNGAIVVNNGFYSGNNYTGPYIDGIVTDYMPGNGRISVGPADGLTLYNGGVGNVALLSVASNGAIVTSNNVYVPVGQVLASNGSVTLPSLSVGVSNYGFFLQNGIQVAITANGSRQGYWGNGTFWADGNLGLLNSSGTIQFGSGDLVLARDAANILAQRNSTNAQTFRLYNTYTSSTSFENLQLDWTSNVATIGTQVGSGGGTARPLAFSTNATERMRIFTSGGVSIGNTTDAGAGNLSVNGKVSIGTATTTAALTIINSAGAGQGIAIQSTNWSYYGRLGATGASGGEQYWTQNWNAATNTVDNASYYPTYILNSASQGVVAFGTGVTTPAERMRVGINGGVSIGNTTDAGAGNLNVNGLVAVGGNAYLNSDAANILAQRNSTNAQTFRLYNTYTDASNYERFETMWSGNVLYLQGTNAGTGSARNIILRSSNSLYLQAAGGSAGGYLIQTNSFIPEVDATKDFGSSSFRHKNAYFSGSLSTGNVFISNTTTSTSNTTGALVVAGGVGVTGNIYSTAVFANDSIAVTANTIINYADPVGTALAMAIALG